MSNDPNEGITPAEREEMKRRAFYNGGDWGTGGDLCPRPDDASDTPPSIGIGVAAFILFVSLSLFALTYGWADISRFLRKLFGFE